MWKRKAPISISTGSATPKPARISLFHFGPKGLPALDVVEKHLLSKSALRARNKHFITACAERMELDVQLLSDWQINYFMVEQDSNLRTAVCVLGDTNDLSIKDKTITKLIALG